MTTLDDNCFAYPSMRKYPIHTKEDALNSYAAFCADKQLYSATKAQEITDRFEKAASYHGITLQQQQTKTAKERPNTVSFDAGDGNRITMNRICDAGDVSAAADYILAKRAHMHRGMLKEASKYVLHAASVLGEDISSEKLTKIAQIAGIGVGDREKIENELEKRAAMNIFSLSDTEKLRNYIKEVKELSDEDFYKEAAQNTICNVLEDMDTLYDNTYKYGKELPYPEQVCFADTVDTLIKKASDMAYIENIDTIISKKALFERKDKANSFFKAYFNDEKSYDGDDLVAKVASLDKNTANALLEYIE